MVLIGGKCYHNAMNELPQKTSRLTPIVIFAGVLLLTSMLLTLRLLLRTPPITLKAHPETFPQTLGVIGMLMIGLEQTWTKENRTVGIILLVIVSIAFLFLVAGYLIIS